MHSLATRRRRGRGRRGLLLPLGVCFCSPRARVCMFSALVPLVATQHTARLRGWIETSVFTWIQRGRKESVICIGSCSYVRDREIGGFLPGFLSAGWRWFKRKGDARGLVGQVYYCTILEFKIPFRKVEKTRKRLFSLIIYFNHLAIFLSV